MSSYAQKKKSWSCRTWKSHDHGLALRFKCNMQYGMCHEYYQQEQKASFCFCKCCSFGPKIDVVEYIVKRDVQKKKVV